MRAIRNAVHAGPVVVRPSTQREQLAITRYEATPGDDVGIDHVGLIHAIRVAETFLVGRDPLLRARQRELVLRIVRLHLVVGLGAVVATRAGVPQVVAVLLQLRAEPRRRNTHHPISEDSRGATIVPSRVAGHMRVDRRIVAVDERCVDIPENEAAPRRENERQVAVDRLRVVDLPRVRLVRVARPHVVERRRDVGNGDIEPGPPLDARARDLERELEDAPLLVGKKAQDIANDRCAHRGEAARIVAVRAVAEQVALGQKLVVVAGRAVALGVLEQREIFHRVQARDHAVVDQALELGELRLTGRLENATLAHRPAVHLHRRKPEHEALAMAAHVTLDAALPARDLIVPNQVRRGEGGVLVTTGSQLAKQLFRRRLVSDVLALAIDEGTVVPLPVGHEVGARFLVIPHVGAEQGLRLRRAVIHHEVGARHDEACLHLLHPLRAVGVDDLLEEGLVKAGVRRDRELLRFLVEADRLATRHSHVAHLACAIGP